MMKNTKKIKLLFFEDHFVCGGVERVLIDIFQHINKNKFDCSLSLLKKKGEFLNEVKNIEIIGIEPIGTKDERLVTRFRIWIRRVYTVYKIINIKRPQIIVLSFPSIISFVVAFSKLLLITRKIKVVTRVESYYRLDTQNFLDRLLLSFLWLITDIILPVSKGSANAINKNFNVAKNKILVIYNGVDIERINGLKNDKIEDEWFENNTLKILSVGNLVEPKGQEYLIKAFKIVNEKGIKAKLIIIGEGYLRKELENLIKKLGLEDDIVLPGHIKNPYKYMKNSDIFVLSSIIEGFGCCIVEAMVCGIPVIATRCPSGPDEIITNNVNGILVPAKDEMALADAIIEIISNKKKAKRLVECGMIRARDFDIKRMVEKHENVFLKVAHL